VKIQKLQYNNVQFQEFLLCSIAISLSTTTTHLVSVIVVTRYCLTRYCLAIEGWQYLDNLNMWDCLHFNRVPKHNWSCNFCMNTSQKTGRFEMAYFLLVHRTTGDWMTMALKKNITRERRAPIGEEALDRQSDRTKIHGESFFIPLLAWL